MNSYIKILYFTLIITVISFILELNKPFIKKMQKPNFFMIILCRYLHFFLFIYFASFMYFFNPKNNRDVLIYLFSALGMFYSWHLLECCILTYYELRLYGMDHNRHYTTFHPTMYSVFNKYSNIVMTIIGILLLINVAFIMYKNNSFPFYAKAIYTIVFLFLFIESVLKSRTGKKQEYPTDEEHILNKYLSM